MICSQCGGWSGQPGLKIAHDGGVGFCRLDLHREGADGRARSAFDRALKTYRRVQKPAARGSLIDLHRRIEALEQRIKEVEKEER